MFISKNDPMPKCNSPVLTLSQIIKFVTSSASEAEMGALLITAQEMILMINTLEEMRWPQPQENLLHVHEWIHRQVDNHIWTPLTTQTTSLTAQTS